MNVTTHYDQSFME